jgi:hypothetical protein
VFVVWPSGAAIGECAIVRGAGTMIRKSGCKFASHVVGIDRLRRSESHWVASLPSAEERSPDAVRVRRPGTDRAAVKGQSKCIERVWH